VDHVTHGDCDLVSVDREDQLAHVVNRCCNADYRATSLLDAYTLAQRRQRPYVLIAYLGSTLHGIKSFPSGLELVEQYVEEGWRANRDARLAAHTGGQHVVRPFVREIDTDAHHDRQSFVYRDDLGQETGQFRVTDNQIVGPLKGRSNATKTHYCSSGRQGDGCDDQLELVGTDVGPQQY
jgi:hypothetical protein